MTTKKIDERGWELGRRPGSAGAPWSQIHWLTVLASQGSFTAAARRLQVSKAAMSMHIADLEKAAGVALVLRTTRSVQLTDAGRKLVDAARSAFTQIEQGFDDVKDLASTPRGLLRVTAPVAFARQQLVPRLPGFLSAHPLVRIELDMSDRLVSLAREGFDLAIRHGASAPDTHVAWKLCETRTVLVASPSYLERKGLPRSPADLSQHECLHYPRPRESLVWHFEPLRKSVRADNVSVAVAGPFAANNSEALRDAALGGLGIALLPDFSADAALKDGSLVGVLPTWRPIGTFAGQVLAIRPYSAHVPRTVQAFAAYLRDVFSGGFPLPERNVRRT